MKRAWAVAVVFGLALALVAVGQAYQHRGGMMGPGGRPAAEQEGTPPMPQQMPQQMQQMQQMMQQMQQMMQQMRGMMGMMGMMGPGMMGMMGPGMMGPGMMGPGMMGPGMMGPGAEEEDEEARWGMRGPWGHGWRGHGLLARLSRELELTEAQEEQVEALVREHVKTAIRAKADLAVKRVELRELLAAEPVDMAKVRAQLQAIAAQQVELHLAHFTLLQDVGKLLTPEQQQKFRRLRRRLLAWHGPWGHGGMMGPWGMMGRWGMMGPGMMGPGGRMGGGMMNPCAMMGRGQP
ncbi:MAG: hypothetical protein KatS3mg131_1400 [Candidatus Tectimicrobiota bacterium]|nr:MAG: hypothetical protein KatS3mg131_1400 [Candidatus Tectomicrobia bacterium]